MNTKRNRYAIVLVSLLVLSLGFAGCSAGADQDSLINRFAGTWQEAGGGDIVIEFDRDGTFEMQYPTDSFDQSGTWEADSGILTLDFDNVLYGEQEFDYDFHDVWQELDLTPRSGIWEFITGTVRFERQ